MSSGFGTADTIVPEVILALARGGPVRVVWENGVGGVTCELGQGDSRRFVKWSPARDADLGAEAARMEWAARYIRVPVVVEAGSDLDGSWIVTLPVPGENAVSPRWLADPMTATHAIGEGLRALHDRLPVASCPFSWSAIDRVEDAERRAAAGEIGTSDWHESHRAVGVAAAIALVRDVPEVDQLVVCHGDTCAPNTLIDDDGHWSGHVDLGSLGVADRWADLAVATWSTEWNYGPGWEQAVLDAYGIECDPDRTRYYRLLWDLGP